MVFSSIPAYNLDPSHWQQVQVPNRQLTNAGLSMDDISPLPPPAPPLALQSRGPGNSIRPGSMAERARIANIPMPEAALKCPRCKSNNTKFCYFNNYTLTQPRHFCKTCRRYWTQGGALRSVPVGGSWRRNNKRSSKSNNNRSNAPSSSGACQTGAVGSTKNATSLPSTGGGGTGGIANTLLGTSAAASSPNLRFMAPNQVHPLGDHFGFSTEFSALSNYGQIITSPSGGAGDLNFHVAGSDSGILGGLADPHSTGFYPFGGSLIDSPGLVCGASRIGEEMLSTGLSHLASMKLEHDLEHNLSRRFQGMAWNYGQHSFDGAGSAWTTDGSADL